MLSKEYQIMHEFETNYWWYVGLHELILHFVKKKSGGEQLSILDAGCGTGRLLDLLKEHNSVGFDFSDEAISFCNLKGIKNVFRQDINNWTSDEKFDIITSIDVICSIGIGNYEQIIKNFFDGLKNDGILILNLPAFESLRRNHDKAVFVGKRFKRNELEKSLIDAGFQIKFISYRLPFLFFVIWFEKIFQKITKNDKAESDLKYLPKFINTIFLFFNRFENFIFKLGIPKIIGSSVFAVAVKKVKN